MIDFDEARRLVQEHTGLMPAEVRPIDQCLGFYLAEEIAAPEPLPSFDSSAMDGFAVLAADVAGASKEIPVTLAVQGEVRPGQQSLPVLQPGEAFRIFTGAPVPETAEAVIMKEYVEDLGEEIRVKRAAVPGEHIRRRGREFEEGAIVFDQGRVVSPSVIGTLAALGRMEAKVFQKPNVAILVTGDELVPPDASILPGQVRDANSHSLAAALGAMGIRCSTVLRARDDEDEVLNRFRQALSSADVVLSVGGVSVGKYDFVKAALKRLDVEEIFWRVAMKPGKPNYFGKKGDKLLFGLPGNTVSSMVSFYLLVRPALQMMQGRSDWEVSLRKARLQEGLFKKDARLEWVRGRISVDERLDCRVLPLKRGSHMLGNLAWADCLICFPKEEESLARDQLVEVLPLYWSES
ncbi:MAG: molybdopterin molybdotransferase MoeA [Planctomycetota bacterium]|jgi:molybdopterin molybdotransferase